MSVHCFWGDVLLPSIILAHLQFATSGLVKIAETYIKQQWTNQDLKTILELFVQTY